MLTGKYFSLDFVFYIEENQRLKKRESTIPEISCFFPNKDVPLQVNSSAINVLEVAKSIVRTFDKNTITQGSSHSYKSSNNLQVDSKSNVHVPREKWCLHPVAVLELLATASQPKLDNHFEQVFKFAEQLCPLEVWIMHFSHEDAVVTDPYWLAISFRIRGLILSISGTTKNLQISK
nr:15548_t:CDS:2 [Entrophospora candida]